MAPDARDGSARPAGAQTTSSATRRRLLIGGAIAVAVWLGAMEFFSRRYGISGPVERFGREFVFGPKRGRVIWASLFMSLVALRGRERLWALGIAAAIDLAFFLGRLPFHTRPTFGNGALWTIVGIGVWGWTRAEPSRRTDILKGVALGIALIVGTKASDSFLLITTRTRELVLDQYVQTADHALGNPSWFAGRLLDAGGPVLHTVVQTIYIELPVAAMLLAIWQIRNGWPRHPFVRTFLLIAMIGPAFYLLFPVVGPIYAYGPLGGRFAVADVWPNRLPFHTDPSSFRFDALTPRNCMPSLHTAWALAIFLHTRREAKPIKWLGTLWLVGTLFATLGFGWHYGVDLVAGAVFTLTLETALRAPERGWYRGRVVLFVAGIVTLAAMLASYRWLSIPMSEYPLVAGPLLLAALAAISLAFYREFFGARNPWTPGPAEPNTAGDDATTTWPEDAAPEAAADTDAPVDLVGSPVSTITPTPA